MKHTLKMSIIIHEENTKKITTVSLVLYVINFMFSNYTHFSVDFENYFTNELIKMVRFLSTCNRALNSPRANGAKCRSGRKPWARVTNSAQLFTPG